MQNEKLNCHHYHCRKVHPGFYLGLIVVCLVILVAAGAIFARMEMAKNYSTMMGVNRAYRGINSGYKVNPTWSNAGNFIAPQDASRKGELAIIVDDLGQAKKIASSIAEVNGGSVYSTEIAYSSSDYKNGSIVIRIPQEKFQNAFEDLRKMAVKVVQESTSEIPQNNIYPAVLPDLSVSKEAINDEAMLEKNKTTEKKSNESESVAKGDSAELISAPAVAPAYPVPVQNQGYIKIIFVDYGQAKEVTSRNKYLAGTFNYQEIKTDSPMLVAIGLKLIVLIVLIILMFIMIIRSLRSLRRPRKLRPAVHVVRQMSKTRSRAVKVSKQKSI